MKQYTYFSLDDLIAAGKVIAAKKECISFDLFDTLLIRRIHDPNVIKQPVARYIVTLAKYNCKGDKEWSWRQVQKLRDQIENKERQKNGAEYPDYEACYPVFMESLLREVFADNYNKELLEQVIEYELAIENSMLVPREKLLQWIKELHQSGKRIFIISDMYLPAKYLKVLVEYAGLLDYVEEIISSADSFNAKASGTGYKLIAEKFALHSENWLHIGDNPVSDGLRAKENGITPLIINDPIEKHRKSLVKRYYNYSDGKPFWRGRILQQLMAPLEAENCKHDMLYIDGYNFFAPLIGIFLQKVKESCDQNGITKIFFLSREGWTFHRFWQEMTPLLYPGEKLPEVEYLYVSRMALAGASCAYKGLQERSAEIAFLPAGNRDFTDLCRIFSLDAESFTDIFSSYGIETTSCLSPAHDGFKHEHFHAFRDILRDKYFQEEVKKQCRDANSALQRYLEDVGFFTHKKIAIVDIGWLGSIQRFLLDAIGHRQDTPICKGFLFGATRGVDYPTSEKNSIEGLIYDQSRFDFAASSLFYARDIFEEACRAPYPTLNGYRLLDKNQENQKGYELVFRQTGDDIGQAELKQDRYFAPLQQGIFDAARRYGAAAALLGAGYQELKPWLNFMLVSKLAFPTAKEVIRIRNKAHLDDFHGRNRPNKKFFKEQVRPLWEYSFLALRWMPLLRVWHFIRHLRTRLNE